MFGLGSFYHQPHGGIPTLGRRRNPRPMINERTVIFASIAGDLKTCCLPEEWLAMRSLFHGAGRSCASPFNPKNSQVQTLYAGQVFPGPRCRMECFCARTVRPLNATAPDIYSPLQIRSPPCVPVHHLKHDGQANSTRWRIRPLHRDVSFRLGCKEFDSRQKKSDWPKPLMDREVRLGSIVPLVSFLSTGKCRLKD